ncbi:MAG: lipopolysaccharide heptosyltransferase II [Gammaproteobacteria bacterium]|nr:lipopolysaccharide heptosyltransferase II [Gammaproteobacteria bacterium]
MARKILVIGPSWVGDMVMAQTLFKLLKQQNPLHQIDVLASDWTFSILSRMPEINQAIPLPMAHGELHLKARFHLGCTLRTAQYDQAIILPNSFKSALIPWFAKIPWRTGYQREGRRVLLTDPRVLNKQSHPLLIEQYMALGLPKNSILPQPYAYPAFSIQQESRQLTLDRLHLHATQAPILALSPGAAFGSAKRWPTEYFAEVAQAKVKEGWQVWLFGSKHDDAITQVIQQGLTGGCHNFAGKVTLAETIDLLSYATGLVTNDSGLMHVAAALQRPLVALYGPTSPKFTPPLSTSARVLKQNLPCQPCFERECPLGHHQCMRELRPQQILSLIAGWGTH